MRNLGEEKDTMNVKVLSLHHIANLFYFFGYQLLSRQMLSLICMMEGDTVDHFIKHGKIFFVSHRREDNIQPTAVLSLSLDSPIDNSVHDFVH